tara:strand:- start:1569 stop:2075 length:507 start_codon:yes stop_codon:yes gene_type:complete
MKYFIQFLVVTLLLFTCCKKDKKSNEELKNAHKEAIYNSFGEKMSFDKVLTSEALLAKYNTLNTGDTLNVKFVSKIKEVCSKKGCWMKLSLSEETEAMVRFKDYGFFMPLDSEGREVIVNGKAYSKETGVKELQHYAEDAGKSEEEITKITVPKIEFAFEAAGVLMKK